MYVGARLPQQSRLFWTLRYCGTFGADRVVQKWDAVRIREIFTHLVE